MRKETQGRKILPVSLLLDGKPCLVVGGGTIAARKVGQLLAAGACVTIVSPSIGDEITDLEKACKVTHVDRKFKAGDVRGNAVVFAVTDDSEVNRDVIEACKRYRVLCSAADAHWVDGDFVSPAVIRHPAATIAISTGGESCSRSRRIKEKLVQFLATEKI